MLKTYKICYFYFLVLLSYDVIFLYCYFLYHLIILLRRVIYEP